jgi:hypothetical protein
MASTEPAVEEAVEAVIVSGARKGEFIRLRESEVELTPEAAALLDRLIEDAQRMAASAHAAAAEAEALLNELRQGKVK